MRRAPLLLACLAGCYAPAPEPGAPCSGGRPCPSGLVCSPATETCEREATAVDARPPADASTCYGTGPVRVCLTQPARSTTLLGTINTDTSPLCVPYDGNAACVVAGRQVAITDDMRATGKRPLIVVGDAIDITGAIDVASHRVSSGVDLGAGAGLACAGGTAPLDRGGGPGGTFGGRGGGGGKGLGNETASAPIVAIDTLRGGCAGRAGQGTTPGSAGAGGGAVYLIARSQITITSEINASGSGGDGATLNGGGGGGGSGGMIGLDAPQILLLGPLYANGGGGGEGAGGSIGNDGAEPTIATSPALGGAGGAPNGGDGGSGAAGALTTGARGGDNTATAGGGGGGGGAGIIRIYSSLPVAGVISPPAS